MTVTYSDFSDHLFGQFLQSQKQLNAALLQDCKADYKIDHNQKTLTIECSKDDLFGILRSKHDQFVVPTVLADVKILIQFPSTGEFIEVSKMLDNGTASAIEAGDAVLAVDSSEHAAAVFLFIKHGLRPMYANQSAAALFKQPLIEMMADKPPLQLRYTENALRSLNVLESLLMRHGKVQEFELVSEKGNGDKGIYIVDATLTRWAGQEARLTIYRTYSLISR